MYYVHRHLYANVAQNSTCIDTKNILPIWIIIFLINNGVHIFNSKQYYIIIQLYLICSEFVNLLLN